MTLFYTYYTGKYKSARFGLTSPLLCFPYFVAMCVDVHCYLISFCTEYFCFVLFTAVSYNDYIYFLIILCYLRFTSEFLHEVSYQHSRLSKNVSCQQCYSIINNLVVPISFDKMVEKKYSLRRWVVCLCSRYSFY